MISCIVLSAGLSQRFGSPKALAKVNGNTVIESLQNMLLKTKLDEIIIVLGAQASLIRPFLLKHKRIKVVYNKDYNFGQTSSFKVGLKNAAPDAKGVFLLPVDYPCITSNTINISIAHFKEKSPLIVVPFFGGQKGHPPLFSTALKSEFFELDNAVGINTVIQQHFDNISILPIEDRGIIQSFNTPEEFKQLKFQQC